MKRSKQHFQAGRAIALKFYSWFIYSFTQKHPLWVIWRRTVSSFRYQNQLVALERCPWYKREWLQSRGHYFGLPVKGGLRSPVRNVRLSPVAKYAFCDRASVLALQGRRHVNDENAVSSWVGENENDSDADCLIESFGFFTPECATTQRCVSDVSYHRDHVEQKKLGHCNQ